MQRHFQRGAGGVQTFFTHATEAELQHCPPVVHESSTPTHEERRPWKGGASFKRARRSLPIVSYARFVRSDWARGLIWRFDVSAGRGGESGGAPSIAIDPVTSRYFIATQDDSVGTYAGLFLLN
jgi:hypothetical protein